MNGSVPQILEKPEADRIDKNTTALLDTFYRGDKLSEFELDTERMYISEKMEKYNNY